MKKSTRSRILCLITAFILVLSLVPNFAFAEEREPDVSGSKEAGNKVLYKYDRLTDITLSLPSAEDLIAYDVVFVMDASTSTVNANLQFGLIVSDVLNELAEKEANIRIGVVKFRGQAFDIIDLITEGASSGLVEYNEENAGTIMDAVNFPESALKELSSGSNLHGGLKMADAMLAADTEVDDSRKFVIMLTDGKNYIWNNEEDEATTYYTQWYEHYAIKNGGMPGLNQKAGVYDKPDYGMPVLGQEVFWFDSFADLYASDHPELLSTSTKYDQRCAYAYKEGTPTGTVNVLEISNGAELFPGKPAYQVYYDFTPDEAWEGMTWFEANPYMLVENEDGSYSFDPENYNPEFYQYHPDFLQKGMYLAAHLWTEMGEKYHTAAIENRDWSGFTGSVIVQGDEGFCTWLLDNSEYAAEIRKNDYTSPQSVINMFNDIKTDILYMVDWGFVMDYITDEFTLVEDGADTFTVTLDGEALPVTYDAETEIWGFGENLADEGYDPVYPYMVYLGRNYPDIECGDIIWEINVPVENAHPVTLTYTLEIYEEAVEGDYPTNESAILYYVPTNYIHDVVMKDEIEFLEYEFPIPVVHYREMRDIDVSKVWDDADDQDGLRPDSVTVELVSGEESFGTVELNEENEWSATFADLWKYEEVEWENEIEYEIKELEVEGYESETEGDMEEGFVITNVHEPELIDITVTKVWDDADDQDGLRPESVAFILLADGEKIDDATVSAEDEWKATFVDLPKYKDGAEIDYSVDEEPVEGYDATVSGSAAEGFVITNTHTPNTGDTSHVGGYAALMTAAAAMYLFLRKKDREG